MLDTQDNGDLTTTKQTAGNLIRLIENNQNWLTVAINIRDRELMTDLIAMVLGFVEYFVGAALATTLEGKGPASTMDGTFCLPRHPNAVN